jgi:arylsulfatase A-like enzyme
MQPQAPRVAGFPLQAERPRILIDVPYLLLALTLLAQAPAREPRPNVLILFADDQRADTIGTLGNPAIRTPHLDRLARRGMAFDRAYMQGGLQGATCVPSRAMLLSGRSLFRIDERLLRDPTWPHAFGEAGYATFLTGKWHNGPASIPASFRTARSVFSGGMTDPMKAPLSDLVDGKLTTPTRSPKHACEAFADEAIRFLREPSTGPFFCYVAFDAPHDPHVVPDDFPTRYAPDSVPLPPNFLPQHPWDNGEMANRDERLLPWPRTPEAVRAMNAEYYRYISYLDAQVGRILDAIDASPHARNTYVVFASDSGVARGSHGLIGKQNLYEGSVRVPLIVAGPGIPEGRRTDALCYLFDVLPTLGKLCGVPAPSTSEGIDLSATLRDPAAPARPRLMFAYRNVQRALRDDRWKLIRYPEVDRTQLFDLKVDPLETTNLAGDPRLASILTDLTGRLRAEMDRFGDAAPLTVAKPRPADWSPPAPGVPRPSGLDPR